MIAVAPVDHRRPPAIIDDHVATVATVATGEHR
jgi:hypothetical protein